MPENQFKNPPLVKNRPRKLDLLYLDATSNVVGIVGPLAAVFYSLRPYREFISTFPSDPEKSLPYLAFLALNVTCGGAFIAAGEDARKRARQMMGIKSKKNTSEN